MDERVLMSSAMRKLYMQWKSDSWVTGTQLSVYLGEDMDVVIIPMDDPGAPFKE